MISTLKTKYNNSLKDMFILEKEKTNLENLGKIIKVNLCNDCIIDKYKKFLVPFNRVSKKRKCIICGKDINNVVILKKWHDIVGYIMFF